MAAPARAAPLPSAPAFPSIGLPERLNLQGALRYDLSLDPNAPEEMAEVEGINARLVARALAMDGTCTGEHGIGLGKQAALIDELGDAVDIMRTIKRALDPRDLFNPGKIFTL